MSDPNTGLQLQSTVKGDGTLEISLAEVETPEPKPNEVVVRVEAAPINPSDLGLLFGLADMSTAEVSGTAERPVVHARVPTGLMKNLAGRIDESMPVGNEGAGVVVGAGTSDEAQALLGKTVAVLGGAMYSQYRTLDVGQCLLLHEGTTAAEGASCFVNPLTALGMVETMRMEGYTALVHTAAASNLGQMLQKICVSEGVDLVNIVRKPEQAELLKGIGAKYVCNSTSPTFMDDLIEALVATGATLAFDATGGGRLAGQILTGMEVAANKASGEYSRYGSTTHKQVYIYGGLDTGPTEFNRAFGLYWGIGGWLLTPFMQKIGADATQKLKERVAAEVKTTFASHYTQEVSLAGALQLDAITAYEKKSTGEKYLVTPNAGLA
ncbi:MAG: zinc-binding dehydrogenase [Pseudomonadales bacterium]|jgi:NADPH2:quinone reductase